MMMETKKKESMLRAALDALPSLVFVVDEDVRIQEYNLAAAGLLGAERATILKHRAGEVLHCLHSTDVPEGCGRAPFCKNCIIRDSVTDAFQGSRVIRRRTRMELLRDGMKIDIYALITASPFCYGKRELVLLVVEDISDILELQRIIPICAVCKKVRDDRESWQRVEAYFKDHWDLDFSHGLCPECYKAELVKLERDIDRATR
jgi:PAS domain-containing protein